MKVFTSQELQAIGIFLDQRKKQDSKEAAMSAALAIIAHRLSRMDMDSSKLLKLTIDFRVLQKNQKKPIPVYSMQDNCYIKLRGVKINDLSLLHGGKYPENQPWLDIERKCLVCNVLQNNKEEGFSKTALQQLFRDLSPYFGRTPDSLSLEWYKLNKIHKYF